MTTQGTDEDILRSLNRLPTEIQLQIAENLSPNALILAAKTGIPLTSKLEARAKHAYTWITILGLKDFELFDKSFPGAGNAFLIGSDLKYIYEGLYDGLPADTPSPMHLFLGWCPTDGYGPAIKSSLSKEVSRYWGLKAERKRPSINLYIEPGPNGLNVIPDLDMMVDAETLRSHILYFKDPESSLRNVTLKQGHFLHGDTDYWINLDISMFPGFLYPFSICWKHMISNEDLGKEGMNVPWHKRRAGLRKRGQFQGQILQREGKCLEESGRQWRVLTEEELKQVWSLASP